VKPPEQRDMPSARFNEHDCGKRVPAPVDVFVKRPGFPGEQVTVTLSAQSTILTESLLLGKAQKNTPSPSLMCGWIRVRSIYGQRSSLEGELPRRTPAVVHRVHQESKLRILMIAGTPSFDVAVIRRR